VAVVQTELQSYTRITQYNTHSTKHNIQSTTNTTYKTQQTQYTKHNNPNNQNTTTELKHNHRKKDFMNFELKRMWNKAAVTEILGFVRRKP
jgi:hypothetical protein